ncbi:MAG: sulfite exporter TauE/SafE family protein [Cyanobacteria bacterium]|nr:sulfite exporter TauE/SafE family protein [Cyanobacteriota bacterium]
MEPWRGDFVIAIDVGLSSETEPLGSLLGIWLLCGIVAFLYASVGHGGASGYLAIFSLMSASAQEMTRTALILNILVASVSFYNYWRVKAFSWKLIAPFLWGSVPMSFLGSFIPLSGGLYRLLLSMILIFLGLRLLQKPLEFQKSPEALAPPPRPMIALMIGGLIGFVSGMIGIGGGIFLSPWLMLKRWATPHLTSGVSAFFIIVNAFTGLAARWLQSDFWQGLEIESLVPLALVTLVGSVAGSYLGAQKFSGGQLRKLLGWVLLIASIKLILKAVSDL